MDMNKIREVNNMIMSQLKLEPILEIKLIAFRDFVAGLGNSLEGTPFGMIAAANPKEIYCFCLFIWSTITRQGKDKVTPELIDRVVRDTCKAHTDKAPEDLISPESLDKLYKYLGFFSEVISKKVE